ncbi:MAG: S8 family serine peptidase [Bacteroidia bacterium]|nr:S8 family serine peptidase [Bacteroidia bacterium]
MHFLRLAFGFKKMLFLSVLCWLTTKVFAQTAISWNIQVAPENIAILQNWNNSQKTAQFPILRQANCILLKPESKPDDSALAVWATLNFPQPISITQLYQTKLFKHIEPNYTRKIDKFSNDPALSGEPAWHHQRVHSFEAWDITTGDSAIIVGIIDTGIDYYHPEFSKQFYINSLEDLNQNGQLDSTDFNGIDDDHNGFIDDVIGYNFAELPILPSGGNHSISRGNVYDDNQHGTIVGGLLAAKSDNGIGGCGIAPNVKLLIVRAFNSSGTGEDRDIAQAIIYAADRGARIINCSFGDVYPSLLMHAAIRYAYQKGCIIIASAGNGTGDQRHFPSDFQEVISVSASSYDAQAGREYLWPVSSFGNHVALCAPGSSVFAPTRSDTLGNAAFGFFSGTSIAAPIVSGAAALCLSKIPTLTPDQMRGRLTATCDDIGPIGWDYYTGAGRVNTFRALNLIGNPIVKIHNLKPDQGLNQTQIPIVATAVHPLFQSFSIDYHLGRDESNQIWINVLDKQFKQVLQDTVTWWDISNIPSGEITLRLRVFLRNQQTDEVKIRLYKDTTAAITSVLYATPVWDDNQRKILVTFKHAEVCTTRLIYQYSGAAACTLTYDRITRNGHFLINPEITQPAEIQWWLELTSTSSLKSTTNIQKTWLIPEIIPSSERIFKPKNYGIPLAYTLPFLTDFNQNNLPEIVSSRFQFDANDGRVKFWEFNGIKFLLKDSVSIPELLIPKDTADITGDFLPELLANKNDSIVLLTGTPFPNKSLNLGTIERGYPARFADTDNDSNVEIIAKDFRNYFILEKNGSTFQRTATLPDSTTNYLGSTAPKALVEDFDQDGKREIVTGDFDGDFQIYENTGNNTYKLNFIHETGLQKSSDYLCAGDMNHNGKPEFFVATHTSTLRDEHSEYEPPYWNLEIWEATADDQYQRIWQDALFDFQDETGPAATMADLTGDGFPELIITNFPKTYILSFQNGNYQWIWFYYGTYNPTILCGDVDKNGLAEVLLGVSDTSYFFEYQPNGLSISAVALNASLVSEDSVQLTWSGSGSSSYQILLAKYTDDFFQGISPISGNSFGVGGLEKNERYVFVVRSVLPDTGAFSNLVFIRTHGQVNIRRAYVSGGSQVSVQFSQPIPNPDLLLSVLKLTHNTDSLPITEIFPTPDSTKLLLNTADNCPPGNYSIQVLINLPGLWIDTTQIYQWVEVSKQPALFLTNWEKTGDNEAILHFNKPVNTTSVHLESFQVQPFGFVQDFEVSSDQIWLRLRGIRLGATGIPVSITIRGITGQNFEAQRDSLGDVATFWEAAADFSEVYAFPNPYKKNSVSEGVTISNLPSFAVVRIYTLQGERVRQLVERNADGGTFWDLTDNNGKRVRPGIFWFVAENDTGQFIGKIAISE